MWILDDWHTWFEPTQALTHQISTLWHKSYEENDKPINNFFLFDCFEESDQAHWNGRENKENPIPKKPSGKNWTYDLFFPKKKSIIPLDQSHQTP